MMNAETASATAEAEIRELLDSWSSAARAKDIDAIVSHYARDIVAFDAIAQLQFRGVDAYKKHWQACMAMCPGPMIMEIHQLNIAASGDVAFAHALSRCGSAAENGEEKTSWMRMSAGYRKRNGKWQIVHEHFSSPFDMESGKALFELEP
jgi:uncharacterized protein (TIGR02246 family)